MRKSFKYRIYPTKLQKNRLNQNIASCRYLYNKTLGVRKDAYERDKSSLSFFDTANMLVKWKKEENGQVFKLVHSQVLQNIQKRVDSAYQWFFRRIKKGEKAGFPRFKGKYRLNSFTYPQSGFKLIQDESLLKLSKIGKVKINLHREIQGQIKTLTILKTSTGKWFAIFSCDGVEAKPLPKTNKEVALDLGIKEYAIMSDKKKIVNPKNIQKAEKKLKFLQSKRDKSPHKSKERRQASLAIRYAFEKLTNKRTDFLHKMSRKLVIHYDEIYIEDLNIKSMMQDHKLGGSASLHKYIVDASWGKFVEFLSYKVEETGKKLIKVNPKNTSKTCSKCKKVKKILTLSDRIFECENCGLRINRDYNASLNILERGKKLISVGQYT